MADDGEGSAYLSLKEQNCWLMTCQAISSDDIFQATGVVVHECKHFVTLFLGE